MQRQRSIEIPPSGARGGISDAWQNNVPDSEAPAKYLVLGPGQKVPNDVTGSALSVWHHDHWNPVLGLHPTCSVAAVDRELRPGRVGRRLRLRHRRCRRQLPRLLGREHVGPDRDGPVTVPVTPDALARSVRERVSSRVPGTRGTPSAGDRAGLRSEMRRSERIPDMHASPARVVGRVGSAQRHSR
jgi:hypothetical protein